MPLPSSGGTDQTEAAQDRKSLSRELHETAQPLTVLQGLLELALLQPGSADEYRDVIQRAAEQSRRVSKGFDHVRRLLLEPGSSTAKPSVSEKSRIEGFHV